MEVAVSADPPQCTVSKYITTGCHYQCHAPAINAMAFILYLIQS